MFRILLESEETPGEWRIVKQEIAFGADAIAEARRLSFALQRPYRVEEHDTELPESQEKKHYEMNLEAGLLTMRLSGIG